MLKGGARRRQIATAPQGTAIWAGATEHEGDVMAHGMIFDISLDELLALKPSCADKLALAERLFASRERLTVADAMAGGVIMHDILWVTCRLSADMRRRSILAATDFAAHVLHIWEARYPEDARPRRAIESVRAAVSSASACACASACASAAAAAYAYGAASAAAASAAAASGAAASAAAAYAAAAASAAGVPAEAAAAEEAWQRERLVAWFTDSDSEPEPWPLP